MKNMKSTDGQEQAGDRETRKPFFARYLEGQELEVVSGGGKATLTLKYPSDGDETVTLKYPSDSDDGGF